MIKTIKIGNYISVQGLLIGHAKDGRFIVRVDDRDYVGYPVA